jgi:Ohr subfamily peroxiredoxin
MARTLYTAAAHVTGGREHGHGRTDDGALEVDLRIPQGLGGPGGGTNPEQLFAVGYAACFENALARVARRAELEAADAAVESAVHLQPRGDGGFQLAVELHVTMPSVADPAQAAALVEAADKVCPYSNALRGNVDVLLTANGRPVG